MPSLDPYLVWTLLSNFDALQGEYLHVLVQTATPGVSDALSLGVIPVHTHAIDNVGSRPVRFFSGLVDRSKFEALLTASQDPSRKIVRLELAEPRLEVDFTRNLQNEAANITVDALKKRLLQPSTKTKPPVRPNDPIAPLVCVLDDRPNALSRALQWAKQPVVASIWHQGGSEPTLKLMDAADHEWTAAFTGFLNSGKLESLGAFLGRRNSPVAPTTRGVEAAELPTYRRQKVFWPLPSVSHGSAVLDLIAGDTLWTGWKPGGASFVPRPVSTRGRPARVHFVQLAIPTVLDTAGGSLAASVLDGIHDALQQASVGQDVIVNLSFGTHSGGHDGTSMLECAIDELLKLYDGSEAADFKTLHVVLPAGNSHLIRCHAHGTLKGLAPPLAADVHRLQWKVQPDCDASSFVEIWLQDDATVQVALQAPGGSRISLDVRPDGKGEYIVLESSSEQTVQAALIAPRKVTQGERGRMVLVAVKPTGMPSGKLEIKDVPPKTGNEPKTNRATSASLEPLVNASSLLDRWLKLLNLDSKGSHANTGVPRIGLAPHGVWTIELRQQGAAAAPFHAWVQRGDTAPMRGRSSRGFAGRQSYFLDAPGAGVDPRFTLNGIATFTHCRLFVVGAMRRTDNCLSVYSAAGPVRDQRDRCEGPDVVVHADESRNRPGLLVSSMLGGARYRVSGTSMAAAVVTRHLYEHLAIPRKADCFLPLPYQDPSCPADPYDGCCKEKVPAGSPEHAPAMNRGIWQRAMPHKDDGSF